MTALFIDLPWSRKATDPSEPGCSKAEKVNSSSNSITEPALESRFRQEDGLPHAL